MRRNRDEPQAGDQGDGLARVGRAGRRGVINPRHPANTAETVRALISDQHPDLAGLAVGAEFVGADMVMYRLGDELAVRLPRSQNTVGSLEAESHWLGQVSANWTFPFP